MKKELSDTTVLLRYTLLLGFEDTDDRTGVDETWALIEVVAVTVKLMVVIEKLNPEELVNVVDDGKPGTLDRVEVAEALDVPLESTDVNEDDAPIELVEESRTGLFSLVLIAGKTLLEDKTEGRRGIELEDDPGTVEDPDASANHVRKTRSKRERTYQRRCYQKS